MPTSLLIRVRFHEGRWHGTGDWPPAPGRLFQALVAGAARGARLAGEDRAALAWLEALPPPVVAAPAADDQRGFTAYVPNNDLDAVGGDPARAIRVGKTIRARLFDADVPLLYLWQDVDPSPEAARLVALARDLHQLGRGVDPAWAEAALVAAGAAETELTAHPGQVHRPGGTGPDGWPVPAPGTLASLERRFAARRARFGTAKQGRRTVTTFTQPPKARFVQVVYDRPPTRLLYELRDTAGERFAPVPAAQAGRLTKGLLAAAARRLSEALPERAEVVARVVLGRDAGPRDLTRRIRLFPVPSIGHEHVDRAIRRVAVEVPSACPLRCDDLDWAFSGLETIDADTGELLGAQLLPAADRAMLDRFVGPARRWRSETPVALPSVTRRRTGADGPKDGSERSAEECRAAAALCQALRHAGVVARPETIRVRREPFATRGTGAEAFAEGTRFPKHSLWHAEIGFDRPIPGPLILGDGRFAGLGLMVPVVDPSPVHALAIRSGLEADSPVEVARALRRAVMARWQERHPRRPLPLFFSGHELDGTAARRGTHTHLAFVADLPRARLMIVPPHVLERRAPRDREEEARLAELAELLEGFDLLRAGCAGRLRLARSAVDPDSDPLLTPARRWKNVTPYRVTRHPRSRLPEAALAEDIAREASRRGLPRPEVEVSGTEAGPRGGLAGWATLRFRTAQKGPILLGRTLHQGGGLFERISE